MELKTDVTIVGFGPVGQFLALKLARAGHDVVVVERYLRVFPKPRAVHFDDEIARLLQSLGLNPDNDPIVDDFDAYYHWRNADMKDLLVIDWSGRGPSGWQRANFFCQPELEARLCELVENEPRITVLRGWNVTGIEETPAAATGPAQAVVHAQPWRSSLPEESQLTVHTQYVVGCDGANSFVREVIGAEVTDLGFAFDWLIVDIKPHEPMAFDPPAVQWCNPAQPTTIVPGGPGRRRWEFMRLPHETIEDVSTEEASWARVAPWGLTPQNATLERHAVYTFRAAWADIWRRGPLLIAGDAAHLMPPFAGQGMCSGLRDSMNLAWRLDAVLSGRSPDTLLDGYGAERAEHVRRFIEMSMMLGQTICVTDPAAAAARDEAMLAAVEDPSLAPAQPPIPRLGPGVVGDHPAAGLLSVQGPVTSRTGHTGLFDDVVGPGWIVLCDRRPQLAAETSAWMGENGLKLVVLGDDVTDDDGVHTAWLNELDAEVAVIRPDHYLFDAGSAGDAERLITGLRGHLGPRSAVRASPAPVG